MTDPTRPAVGLSVGATTLAAVTPDNSVTHPAVCTLPSGVVITDFVDRVGDPVGIVASDGSVHRAENLLAEALRSLAYAATAGRPLPPTTAITYPAHWRPPAVDALRRAVRQVPEWSAEEPLFVADTTAALTALTANPGLPTRGVIALCDFGGSGTSITLVDGATSAPIAPTLRHPDFSGDLIDQGLLAHVIAELSAGGTLDITGTSAIGSLTRLRAECRAAKERLSTVTVTALPAQLPNFRGDVRLTRTELDGAMGHALNEFVAVLQDTLARNGVRPAHLAAVASIGGAAAIPVITTTLSEHLRVPVITTPRPALTGAIGGALRATRGPADDSATAMAPAPVVPVAPFEPAPAPATGVALAWSEAPDVPDLAPAVEPVAPAAAVRPLLDFESDPEPAGSAEAAPAWYRRPMPVVAAALLVILMAGAGTAVALRADSSAEPVTPTPSVTTTPQAAAPAPPPPTGDPTAAPVQNQAVQQAPAPQTVMQQAPAPVTVVQQAPAPPPVTAQAPPPPPPVTETQTTTVVTTEVFTPPPVTQTETQTVAPPTQQPQQPRFIPTIPPIPTIPGIPQIFVQPPPSG
ncbi:Hsp70 family protein [Mycobacterium crocinum]|uniref:Hsp70 family protein n=1 Tax=Mycolicibacterium crocinum TaxID=388459 RepID=A0ABY3TL34_9MYCO|nr:Hsp70 family protein [Mycolicibacterium crocinum]MCV7218399.1 Hsp70 family protein [Mycolicibacterium crocinum]ULN39902.1 Hsp70 family protein [Mycolicibacterium crocinum]